MSLERTKSYHSSTYQSGKTLESSQTINFPSRVALRSPYTASEFPGEDHLSFLGESLVKS